jgi:zinc protease
LRVKVREQMGGAYSPYARSDASDVFPGYGYISAHITVDPALAQKIADAVTVLASDLAKGGVTADELSRSKNPVMTSLRESVRTNGYWTSVLSRAQEKPEVLDWARTRQADFESITEADMNVLAATYLGAAHESHFTVIPLVAPAP